MADISSLKIGFIGAGNMGKAIISGILDSNLTKADKIYAADIFIEGLEKYAQSTGINVCMSNTDLVREADIIILSVKPNILSDVLNEIKDNVGKKLIISIVAGASVKKIKDILGSDSRVVRTMPNTPALVSEGMTAICYDDKVTEDNKQAAESIFQSIGKVEIMDEKYLNSVIALSSSSPAYFFMMIEAMADAAVLAGMTRNISYKMAAQTMLGSAKMVLETGKHPGELKDMVCSPAGTTIEAVAELEKTGFRNSIISAMKACTDKADRME